MILVLPGCSSSRDDDDEPQLPEQPEQPQEPDLPQEQHAMGFTALLSEGDEPVATSRADRTRTTRAIGDGEFTTTELKLSGFGVYCWYTGSADFSTAYASTTALMLNQKVVWDAVSPRPSWTYSPTKYWPLKADEKLTLRAYAPYVSYNLQTDATTGMPLLPVVVTKDDYHDGTQHDPLWGTGRLVNPNGEYDPIPADEEERKAILRYGTLYNNITYKMSGDWRDKPTDHIPADTRDGTIDWFFHHGMSKLMFTVSLTPDPGCDNVTITRISIGELYTQGLLSLSSPTASESEKPIWPLEQRSGNMTVTLQEATPDNTIAGDLAPIPEPSPKPDGFNPYPFTLTPNPDPAQPSDPVDLLSHGLLIIPRDFPLGSEMTISVTYYIDGDPSDPQTAVGKIKRDFEGNTSYTLGLKLTPETKGLQIDIVKSAFTEWKPGPEGTHTVVNW